MTARSLTIAIPALNEAARIETAILEVLNAAQRCLADFEIIVIDDGSTDETGAIVDRLAAEHACISAIHHQRNSGVSAAFASALAIARCVYITVIPGDNAFAVEGVNRLFDAAGSADLVISYRQNMGGRKPLRRLLAKLCTWGMRLATFTMIRDAHSMVIYRVDHAREAPAATGYTYQIETLAHLLRRSDSYVEVPVSLNPHQEAHSSVMRWSVIAGLAKSMILIVLRLPSLRGSAANPMVASARRLRG